jgi:hypothetical protein
VEQTAIEVYQETGFDAAEPQVSQDLCFEQRVYAFHALQLQDHQLLDNDVQPQLADGSVAVFERERNLALKLEALVL